MVLLHGGFFWHQDNAPNSAPPTIWLEIVAVIPAHDKADVIGTAITSLLNQDYPLPLSIILVDDGSQDGTANSARAIIPAHATDRLKIITGAPKLPEWADKVWAMKQGTVRAVERRPNATYILFTDADIKHHTSNLRGVAARADANRVDLASLMVRLCDGLDGVWNIVARGSFPQLRYSPFLSLGRVLGMSGAVSDATLGFDPLLFHKSISTAIFCAATWVLMAVTAVPTYESYGQSWRAALVFPWSAALFTAMTFYSVWRHWRGRGGGWKGRTYSRYTRKL